VNTRSPEIFTVPIEPMGIDMSTSRSCSSLPATQYSSLEALPLAGVVVSVVPVLELFTLGAQLDPMAAMPFEKGPEFFEVQGHELEAGQARVDEPERLQVAPALSRVEAGAPDIAEYR